MILERTITTIGGRGSTRIEIGITFDDHQQSMRMLSAIIDLLVQEAAADEKQAEAYQQLAEEYGPLIPDPSR